jgi:hypothetical protein
MVTTIWNPSETSGELIVSEDDETILLEDSNVEGIIPETDGYLPETIWSSASSVLTTWAEASLPTTTWAEV